MSVAIATLGKFVPAVGSGTPTIVERVVYRDRGTSVGWETVHKKPTVVISKLEVEESTKKEDIMIEILSIEED